MSLPVDGVTRSWPRAGPRAPRPARAHTPTRAACPWDARRSLSACSLDGDTSRRLGGRRSTRRPLALDHEILDIEGLADHPEPMKLERHLLVHGAIGGESDYHRNVGRRGVEQMRQLLCGHRD